MPFSAKAVANEFIALAKQERRSLTPMQVLKLVYLAHGWHLAITGKPLLDERIEAWRFGPVVPSIYHEFKKYGNGPIKELAKTTTVVHDGGRMILSLIPLELRGDGSATAKKIIREVWEKYKHLSAVQLSNLTHLPDSPWSKTPNKDIKGTDIQDGVIQEYFHALAARK
jgi:uncharacterized phage-associated protein